MRYQNAFSLNIVFYCRQHLSDKRFPVVLNDIEAIDIDEPQEGEASRFLAVLAEYEQAPEVTRRRLYLETLERVLGDVDLVILDSEGGSGGGGTGVVPYLPLNELRRSTTTGSSN